MADELVRIGGGGGGEGSIKNGSWADPPFQNGGPIYDQFVCKWGVARYLRNRQWPKLFSCMISSWGFHAGDLFNCLPTTFNMIVPGLLTNLALSWKCSTSWSRAGCGYRAVTMGPCPLHHWIQSSMEAILACHPAVSTEWLAGWQFYFPHTMTCAHGPH